MAKRVVCVEIAEESIRAVELRAGRRPVLLAAGEVPLPQGAAKDSEVLDGDAVALALRQLWTQAGIKGRRVVLGVANRRILVREYAAPMLRADLLKAALPFEVQDLLPVPVEQAVLDFFPIAERDGQMHGLLVAAVTETIEALISTLAKARLKVDAVDFTPFALARVARRVTAPGETVAIVGLGEHTSSVVITVDGVPRFVRIIPVDLNGESLAARGTASMAQGEQLVPARRALAPAALLEADPGLSDLVARVRGTVEFYASRPDTDRVTTVLLVGGPAGWPGVVEVLDDAVDAQVRTVGLPDLLPFGPSEAGREPPWPSLVSTVGLGLTEER